VATREDWLAALGFDDPRSLYLWLHRFSVRDGGRHEASSPEAQRVMSPRRRVASVTGAGGGTAAVRATGLTTAKTLRHLPCLGVANHLPNRNSDWSFFPMAFLAFGAKKPPYECEDNAHSSFLVPLCGEASETPCCSHAVLTVFG
jgi:hypothetical protein